MTEADSDDLDGVLDRFEARVYRRWAFRDQRIRERRWKQLESAGGPSRTQPYETHPRPSLDHYDGTQER